MMRFIRSLVPGCFASCSGCGCLVVLLVGLTIYSAVSVSLREIEAADTPRMLVINLSEPVVNFATNREKFSLSAQDRLSISVWDFERKILKAAADPNIYGIALVGSFTSASLSQIAEARNLLADFKESGKPVYAYLENPGLAEYYLASVASEVYMNPYGVLEFKGISINSAYFANALKKYGIDAQVIKAGKYKSFGEIFTSDKMSPENREILSGIAGDIWSWMLEKIGASRDLSADSLRQISETNPLLEAGEALNKNMVDALMYRSDFVSKMSECVGRDKALGSFNQISLLNYGNTFKVSFGNIKSDRIALVYLSGEIVDSEVFVRGKVASRPYCKLLRDLAKDDSVKGVVLRIDSPGGSAYASEEIRHEVELLAAKKPVVASMGATAASGAYWIACAADKIFAQQNTITGSIGVFAVKFSGKTLANNFGITFDGVKTSPMADIDSLTRPLNESEIAVLQKSVDSMYDKFIKTVSKGRKLPESEVLKLAEGKIYLAGSATKTGLFDEIGGLTDALKSCTKADSQSMLLNLDVIQYPYAMTLEEFIMSFSEGAEPFANVRKFIFERFAPSQLETLLEGGEMRAQMPLILEIK